MAKPPATPPSRDRGSETEDVSHSSHDSAEKQEVSRRGSAGRPPQTKQ